MPREIKNKLRQGLPSKLYYLAYSEPKSIYQISKEIYNKVQPQKLYKWKKWFLAPERKYFFDVDGKVQSSSEPLLNEIIDILKSKGKELDKDETEFIKLLLNSDLFKIYIKSYAPDVTGEFDGLENLVMIFDTIIIQWLQFYKENPRIPHCRTVSESKRRLMEYKQEFSKKEAIANAKEIIKNEFKDVKKIEDAIATIDFEKSFDISLFPTVLMLKIRGISNLGKIFLMVYLEQSKYIQRFGKNYPQRGFRKK